MMFMSTEIERTIYKECRSYPHSASGGAVVEFTLKEEGEYPFLTHQLKHAEKGALGKIISYSGEIPEKPVGTEAETSNQLKINANNFQYDERVCCKSRGGRYDLECGWRSHYRLMNLV